MIFYSWGFSLASYSFIYLFIYNPNDLLEYIKTSHGHIGWNQMNRNLEPKTVLPKGKS